MKADSKVEPEATQLEPEPTRGLLWYPGWNHPADPAHPANNAFHPANYMYHPSPPPPPLANGSMAGACLRRRCKPKVNSSLSQHEGCWSGRPHGTQTTHAIPAPTGPTPRCAEATSSTQTTLLAAGSGVAKFAPFQPWSAWSPLGGEVFEE